MKRTKLVMILGLVLAMIVAGCGGSSAPASSGSGSASTPVAKAPDSSAAPNAQAGTIVIGETAALSGPLAVYGVPQNNAIKLAIKHINEAGGLNIGGKKYQVKLISLDDQFNPTTSLSNIKKMVEQDKVQFLVGFISGSSIMPAFPYIKENKLVTMVGAAPDKVITATPNPYVFHVRPPSDFTGFTSGKFIGQELKFKKVGVIGTVQEGFFKDLVDGVKEGFESTGGSFTTIQGFKIADQDVSAQLTKVIATNPDAIYVAADVESAAFVYKQSRQLGFKGQLLGFNGGGKPQFEKIISASQLEGIYDMIPAEINPSDQSVNGPYAKAFLGQYQAEFKEEAAPLTGYGYDLMMMLAAGIEKAGTTEPDAVVKALEAMSVPEKNMTMKWLPVGGRLFDSNHQAYIPNAAFVWSGGDKKVHKEMESPVDAYSAALAKIRAAAK